MSASVHETTYDPAIREFMQSFDSYLIAQVIAREYERPRLPESGETSLVPTINRLSRSEWRPAHPGAAAGN